MADQYTLLFPDGTQYGPIDRATLESWSTEGRIPDGALVWPDGAPDWLRIEEVLSPARADAASSPAPDDDGPPPEDDAGTQPHTPDELRGGASRRAGLSSHGRALLLVGGGAVLVVVLLAGLISLLRPALARRSRIADIEKHAIADRRVGDARLGFVVDLPPGWVALREDNPYVVTRGARLAVSYPALDAFGEAQSRPDPDIMGDLDRQIDLLLQERVPSQPSLREDGRADVQLGRGRGRLVRTHWEDGLDSFRGATAVWVDGYEYYWLEAWAPASAGEEFDRAFVELVGAIAPSGNLAARVEEAAERLSVEVPELPREALRLLIGERMSKGEALEDVPVDALRAVSRGLEGLSAAEAREMGEIYGQIWEPVPELQRRRLAQVLALVKADRPVPAAEVRALREAVKAGVLALPPEQRERLQELSGRAVERSLVLR
ncbi:MAG: DUF4339 domain-containing protein [Acidobacteriota bacterium]|jgi:hypothetical protein